MEVDAGESNTVAKLLSSDHHHLVEQKARVVRRQRDERMQ